MQMPLGVADGQVHLGGAAAQADPSRLGVAFKKFLVEIPLTMIVSFSMVVLLLIKSRWWTEPQGGQA